MRYNNIIKAERSNQKSEKLLTREEFLKLNNQQKAEAIFRSNFVKKFTVFFLYYLAGVLIYNQIEGWDVLHSVFYLTATITTVGFGDLHPTKDISKVFTIFFILFGVPIVFGIALEISSALLLDCQEYMIVTFMAAVYNQRKITPMKLKYYRVYLSVATIILLLMCGALYFSGEEPQSQLS
jgi:hypothetical protein